MDMNSTLPEGWKFSDLSVYATLHHLVLIPSFAPMEWVRPGGVYV